MTHIESIATEVKNSVPEFVSTITFTWNHGG